MSISEFHLIEMKTYDVERFPGIEENICGFPVQSSVDDDQRTERSEEEKETEKNGEDPNGAIETCPNPVHPLLLFQRLKKKLMSSDY